MHYLDHSATTPLIPEARDAVLASLDDETFGNPSSVHAAGRRAREVVEIARERVAGAIGASPAEIVFTGGGTEADNLAIKGTAEKLRAHGNHIVTTTFEHHAVLDSFHFLERHGYEATYVEADSSGVVDPQRVAAAVRPGTILVSVMTVNNEIGTIQPMAEIVRAVKDVNRNTLVHTDAVQALGKIPVDVHAWGVDLAAFAAHKLGGPKGTGALFVRSHVPVEALIHGGGHEHGFRSGTLNVAGIAGFGVAAELSAKDVEGEAERLRALRDRLLEGIRGIEPDASVNGDVEHRVAGNLNVSIPGADGETLLLLLDQAGIACSTGSACQSGAADPSHVLLSIGVSKELANASLRFTLGRTSVEDDVDAALAALPEAIARSRKVA
ncbi:MAG: cysteine desulfurase family protein [Actinomycetota bacterium]